MVGMAQKGGAVLTHLKIAPTQDEIGAPRVSTGGARLVLGCDIVVTAGPQPIPTMRKDITAAIVNRDAATTGDFTRAPDLAFPAERMQQAIMNAAGPVSFIDAGRLATRLVGDAIGANLFLVGYAWQRGLIPLTREGIERAIEVNDVQVAFNRQAFLWGRRAAHDLAAVEAVAGLATKNRQPHTLDDNVEHSATFLAAYQDEAYARRYREIVARMRTIEAERVPGRDDLALAVARNLFKLMAVKDEYEVARLWTDGSFLQQLAAEFERWDSLEVHLAPPLLADRDPTTGHLKKRRYGPWMLRAFRLLARLKRLRGTALDPFARSAERRMERQLLRDYETLLDEFMRKLDSNNHRLAVELARLPQQIRGFGHVKEANLTRVKTREAELIAVLRDAAPMLQAAE
jgi:indolepyruvate ferredoxin oxidoreductase